MWPSNIVVTVYAGFHFLLGALCSLVAVQVIVGTHGNLRIFRRKGWLLFSCLKVVVLDEADHMIEREGFRDDTVQMMELVDRIALENGLPVPQLLLFSATYRADIKDFSDQLLDMGKRSAHKVNASPCMLRDS